MASAIPISTTKNDYNPNLLPVFLTFDSNIDYTGWNVVTGSITASNTTGNPYKGDRYLSLFSTNTAVYAEVNSGGVQTRFTAIKTGLHRIQFQVRNPTGGKSSGDILDVKLSVGGVGVGVNTTVTVRMDQLDGIFDVWKGLYYSVSLSAGQTVDFSFGIPVNGTGNSAIDVDGIKMECDDRLLGFPTPYTYPQGYIPQRPDADGDYFLRVLSDITTWEDLTSFLPTQLTVSIDFPSINAGEFYDYEYDAAPLTFAAGQVMLVQSQDETNPKPDIMFTAKRKGATGDAGKIIIRANNLSASPINLANAFYTIKILP